MDSTLKRKILDLTEDLNDVDKAGLAAALLSDTDPRREVLDAFFKGLCDTSHDEIVVLSNEQELRNP